MVAKHLGNISDAKEEGIDRWKYKEDDRNLYIRSEYRSPASRVYQPFWLVVGVQRQVSLKAGPTLWKLMSIRIYQYNKYVDWIRSKLRINRKFIYQFLFKNRYFIQKSLYYSQLTKNSVK